jgi:hypothetical protein
MMNDSMSVEIASNHDVQIGYNLDNTLRKTALAVPRTAWMLLQKLAKPILTGQHIPTGRLHISGRKTVH